LLLRTGGAIQQVRGKAVKPQVSGASVAEPEPVARYRQRSTSGGERFGERVEDTARLDPISGDGCSQRSSPGSYGLVLVMIMGTYGIAVSLSLSTWHATLVLLAQASPYGSRPNVPVRRSTLLVADVVLVLAALIAIGSGFGADAPTTRGSCRCSAACCT
jgi:hypothetical protein